jgi:hypothetical protein
MNLGGEMIGSNQLGDKVILWILGYEVSYEMTW